MKKLREKMKIVEYYMKCGSLKETASAFEIGWQKVRKILITEGAYTSEIAEKVQKLYNSGVSISEIAEKLKISKSTVNSYLSYTKAVYNKVDATENATRIRRWRAKQKQKSQKM